MNVNDLPEEIRSHLDSLTKKSNLQAGLKMIEGHWGAAQELYLFSKITSCNKGEISDFILSSRLLNANQVEKFSSMLDLSKFCDHIPRVTEEALAELASSKTAEIPEFQRLYTIGYQALLDNDPDSLIKALEGGFHLFSPDTKKTLESWVVTFKYFKENF